MGLGRIETCDFRIYTLYAPTMNASILTGQNSDRASTNWRELGHRYFPLNVYLAQRFGCRVQKLV